MKWTPWVLVLASLGCNKPLEEEKDGAADSGDTDTYETDTWDTDSTTTSWVTPNDVVPAEGVAVVDAYFGGTFEKLPSSPVTGYGAAQLVRMTDGTSELSVHVSGLSPDTTYATHVHTWPCSYEGGGHYKYDPTVEETVETNEVWPSFTTGVSGAGYSWTTIGAGTRGDAMSVVVHDPATGEKALCADLSPALLVGGTGSGTIAPFADYEVVDNTIAGSVTASFGASTFEATVSLSGLDPASTYPAHVHALPCDTNYAGGHYKFDPSVEETLATNEIWPTITVAAGGTATATISLTSALREDAQAIVLHRYIDEYTPAPKVACANIYRDARSSRITYGDVSPLPAAAELGYPNLDGYAQLTRRLDGSTVAKISVEGLKPDVVHTAHVHEYPCAVEDGGGHYLIDRDQPGSDANEIWLDMKADSAGKGSREFAVGHIARADAQAVVVHAPTGERLACIQLY